MRERMRPGLFEEWLEFERLEPYGFPLRNLQMAYTLATLSNTVGGGRVVDKKRREGYRTEEFLMRPEQKAQKAQPARLSQKASNALVTGVFAALGIRGKPLGES